MNQLTSDGRNGGPSFQGIVTINSLKGIELQSELLSRNDDLPTALQTLSVIRRVVWCLDRRVQRCYLSTTTFKSDQ